MTRRETNVVVVSVQEEANNNNNHNNSSTGSSSSSALSTIFGLKDDEEAAPHDVVGDNGDGKDNNAKYPVVDIVTIGSQTRPRFMDVQEQTFGSHPAIRNFFRFNELNDTETNCVDRLTTADIDAIARKCKTDVQWKGHLHDFNKEAWSLQKVQQLIKTSNPVGWKCAQKRPVDAMFKVLTQYRQADYFPDYLLLVDDDTWLHLPAVLDTLVTSHPAMEPHAVAGCRYRFPRKRLESTTIGVGGWGNFFTKAVLQRFVAPIYCSGQTNNNTTTSNGTDDDEFQKHVCAQLKENLMGEAALFRDGMSVNELVYRYTFYDSFANLSNWNTTNGVAYCFNSDWVYATFVNFYHLTNRIPYHWRGKDLGMSHERTAAYGGDSNRYQSYVAGQCANGGNDMCTTDSHICHKASPEHLYKLWQQQQAKAQQ